MVSKLLFEKAYPKLEVGHSIPPVIGQLTNYPFIDTRCIYLGVRGCAGSPTLTRDKIIS